MSKGTLEFIRRMGERNEAIKAMGGDHRQHDHETHPLANEDPLILAMVEGGNSYHRTRNQ